MADYIYNNSAVNITDSNINDRFNPFKNQTEFKGYNQDYRNIVPQIAMKNCTIPDIPSGAEKKRIRHYFNSVGFLMTGQVVLVNIFAFIVMFIAEMIIAAADGTAAVTLSNYSDIVMEKITNSSINMAATGFCYMLVNIIVFMAGCKMTGIERSSLFQTKDLTFKLMLKYSVIAIFLQMISALIANMVAAPLIDEVFGVDIYQMLEDTPTTSSVTKMIATILYTCIIAPVTEELVLRGFVLKNLSRVSQKFGIVVSALIFALMHENIPQFILAFMVGIFLAYVTVKHNSLVPSIILHIIVNSTNTIISLIAEINENLGNVIYGFWVIFFIIAGAVVLIYSLVSKSEKMPETTDAQKKRGIPVMFTSVGMILLIIVHLSLMFIYM
jgi:hypothetical protein